MNTPDLPTIECLVSFLPESEGGRRYAFPDGWLSSSRYRPHLVVGDPQQRTAIVDDNNVGQEEYLGVAFLKGPEVIEFGTLLLVQLVLLYHPYAGYARLVKSATFTIREDRHVVGYGTVTQAV